MRMANYGIILSLIVLAGCGQNAVTLHSQNQALAQQQQVLAQSGQELQTRAAALDRDNQELGNLLAQSRQQIQLLKEEVTLVKDQLRSSNEQLASLRQEKDGLQRHTQAMVASMEKRNSATIRANNSLVGKVNAVLIPGVEVRQDGDVIRIELPGEKLFAAAANVVLPSAIW